MKTHFIYSPEGASGAAPVPPPTPKVPKARGAFNREVAALLAEAADLVVTARDARFAPMLASYDITSVQIDALAASITLANEKFSLASSGSQSGQAATSAKDALEEDLEAAIRPIQTGARLTYANSAADQHRYFIGEDLGADESQLEMMTTTILQNLQNGDVLRGVTPAVVKALKDAYNPWHAAVLAQSATQKTPQQMRAEGNVILGQIAPVVREIKIAGDGAYTYKNPVNRSIRALFHIPENRPYSPKA